MRFAAFKDLTRFEQTLFGLPFLLSGACLALLQEPLSPGWLWIFPAFLLARISGMAFNQLIDREIDGRNPRTELRPIPSGKVTLRQARFVAWGTLILFLLVCCQINLPTALLSLGAAVLLYIYSYMKRIHYTCHVVLGVIHFLGPVMAYVATTESFALPIFFLGGAACFLLMGTDIVYAIQDYEFDKRNDLWSFPSKFGVASSLNVSAYCHIFCLLMLLGVGLTAHFPLLYYLSLPVMGVIFIYFHRHVRTHQKYLRGIESSFFLCTVSISFSALFFIATSCVWRAMS